MTTKSITEKLGVVNVFEPKDWEAGGDGDSISTKMYRHLTLIFTFGALTGNAVLSIYSGATDGTKTTKENFDYRLSDGDYKAAAADQFGNLTADSDGDLTLTATTYDNRILVVEVDVNTLTADQPFVTAVLDATASVALASCVAILSDPRFEANDMPTAIPA